MPHTERHYKYIQKFPRIQRNMINHIHKQRFTKDAIRKTEWRIHFDRTAILMPDGTLYHGDVRRSGVPIYAYMKLLRGSDLRVLIHGLCCREPNRKNNLMSLDELMSCFDESKM